MRKLEEKLEEMEKKLEDRMCEEMREREIRRLNLVLHRVEEPSQRIPGTDIQQVTEGV
jgi:hypothetical protein